jgi:hypothetical protein
MEDNGNTASAEAVIEELGERTINDKSNIYENAFLSVPVLMVTVSVPLAVVTEVLANVCEGRLDPLVTGPYRCTISNVP